MGRPKEYERDTALRKAKELFWRRGYIGASIGDLLAATGMPRQSLYTEFGSKAELFVEALRAYAREEGDVYRHYLARVGSGFAAIAEYFDGMVFGPGFPGCFLVNSIAEREVLPERAREIVSRFFDGVHALFRARLEEAHAAGDVRSDLDPNASARFLVAFDQGLALAGKYNEDEKEMKDAVKQALSLLRC